MNIELVLQKMKSEYHFPVRYFLETKDGEKYDLNSHIGKLLTLTYQGEIVCQGCQKSIKKSFAQGYCYNCFLTHPDTEECVLRPELCKAHLGIARNMEDAAVKHLAPHYVYLSSTSNLKVGVTRETQIPYRWIDQGASQAIKILKVPNRHIAGVAEVFLKQFYKDKTAWQKMILSTYISDMLLPEKEKIIGLLPKELSQYADIDNKIVNIEYPVGNLAGSVQATTLDKQNSIRGVLTGIKGQYLIFDEKVVFNVRSHSGYCVKIEIKA